MMIAARGPSRLVQTLDLIIAIVPRSLLVADAEGDRGERGGGTADRQ